MPFGFNFGQSSSDGASNSGDGNANAGNNASGGDGQGGNGQQGQQGQDGKQGGDSNLNVNPWAPNVSGKDGPENSPPKGDDSQSGNLGQNTTGAGADDPNATFNNFIDSLDFQAGIDFNQIGQDLGIEGGQVPDSLKGAFDAVGKNAFKQAMLFANKLMDKRAEQILEQAVDKTSGKINTDMAFNRLFEKLPILNDEATSPVAKAVMSGFIKKGQGVDEAIENTGKYFENQTRKMAKHLNLHPPRGSNGQFVGDDMNSINQNDNNRGYQGFGDHQNQPDWFNVLKA